MKSERVLRTTRRTRNDKRLICDEGRNEGKGLEMTPLRASGIRRRKNKENIHRIKNIYRNKAAKMQAPFNKKKEKEWNKLHRERKRYLLRNENRVGKDDNLTGSSFSCENISVVFHVASSSSSRPSCAESDDAKASHGGWRKKICRKQESVDEQQKGKRTFPCFPPFYPCLFLHCIFIYTYLYISRVYI